MMSILVANGGAPVTLPGHTECYLHERGRVMLRIRRTGQLQFQIAALLEMAL